MATNRAVQAILITKDQPAITSRAAQAIVITQDPPTAMIRNVRGYALTAPPAAAQLRNVRGYALTAVPKAPPTAQTGINAMLWLLNQNISLGSAFTLSQISIGAPSAYSDPTGRTNSQVLVTALSGSGFKGSMTAYYNRRTIESVFNSTAWLLGTISSATTIRALIPQINTAYGVGLDPSDVVDGPVAAGATSLVLTATSGSYMLKPGSALRLPSVSLSSAVLTTALAGFDNAAGVGPRTSTLGLFHFDGTSSTPSLVDAAAKNTATSSGTVSTTLTSKFGTQAITMGSANASVVLPDASWLRFTGQDATLEAWVSPSSTSQNGVLFSKEPTSTSVYTELQYYQGNWRLWLDSGSLGMGVASSMQANTYTHIALVSYKGVWYLYENGVLKGQVTGGNFGNNTAAFRIGNSGPLNAAFQGLIDEVRISNYARYTAPFTPPTLPFVVD